MKEDMFVSKRYVSVDLKHFMFIILREPLLPRKSFHSASLPLIKTKHCVLANI